MKKSALIEKVAKLLYFLPFFEDTRQQKYKILAKSIDPYAYSTETSQFIRVLYEEGFIQDFNWVNWQDESSKFINNPSLILTADLETLQKLLTTHVRADRFCSGYLARMIDRGQILAILQRLKAIKNSLTNPT